MHLNENQLRAFLDDELDPGFRQTAAAHLTDCADCSRRISQMSATSAYVRGQLNFLSAHPSQKFKAHEALERQLKRRKEPFSMKTLFRKPASIAVGVVVLLAISLLFPPVRAIASDFLGLFRVQQVKVVTIDPAMLSHLDEGLQGNEQQIRQIIQENFKKVKESEFKHAETPEQAAEMAGFTPRLPANGQVASIGVMSAQTYEITIDTDLWNTILTGMGYQGEPLSSDLNGQKITVDVPAGVSTGIGECKSLQQLKVNDADFNQLKDCILLVELPSPVVQTPDGLDIPALAESMLEIFGMDPSEARQFSQSTDWANTLVLPIPSGEGVTNQQVSVDGTSATLITHETNDEYMLFWVRNGVLYAVLGSGDSQAGVDLGASLPQ